MWYGKTRVTSSKLKSTSWKFKNTSWNSKVRVRIGSTSYEFESTTYEFESTSHKFEYTSHEFESTTSGIIKNSMKTFFFSALMYNRTTSSHLVNYTTNTYKIYKGYMLSMSSQQKQLNWIWEILPGKSWTKTLC